MSDSGDDASPHLKAYAAAHGLAFYEHWTLPTATQLLRHGEFQDARSLALGDLPGGLRSASLAHFDYLDESGGRHYFTVVVVAAPESLGVASRVLCHDRGLDEAVRANPETDTEIVLLDDRAVRLESEAFLRRYTLSADHDQDELHVWQLFDPDLVDWLTTAPPRGFSFELQDGGLCCFVPELLTGADELDAICADAARVHGRVAELAQEAASMPAAGRADAVSGSRESRFQQELAAHPLDSSPKSVRAAARALRHGLFVGAEDWRLGAEAFFRAYAESLGMRPIEVSAFRASHLELFVADDLSHVAAGPLPIAKIDGFLLLADDRDGGRGGQTLLVADIAPQANGYAFAVMPETEAVRRQGIDIVCNGPSIMVFAPDDGPRRRTRESLDHFRAIAEPYLAKVVAAAEGRI